jgi:phosphohistidine swiveling domain-containing protein
MSRISKSVAVLVALLAFATSGSSALAAQIVPQTLTQQGRLLDSDGAPVDGVQLTFTFSLYTTASAGTAIWSEQQTVTPDNGYFSAKIGEGTAFTSDIFDGSRGTLYLGIKIGSDAEMAPRQELTSVPFAMLALNAVSASHADTADLATKATSATTADLATKATNADLATKATNATSADTVKSIAGNLVAKETTLSSQTAVLACDSGTVMVSGGCSPSGTGAYVVNAGYYPSSSSTTLSTKSYTCTCGGNASCSGIATVICAK